MIKARFGDRLDGWLEATLPFLFRRPVNPNVLTVVGTLSRSDRALRSRSDTSAGARC